jgi:hypothetical protein
MACLVSALPKGVEGAHDFRLANDFKVAVKEEHSFAITEHCEQIKHQSSVICRF